MRRAVDWGGTILFGLFFGLTLIGFDILLRLATPLGRRPLEHVAIWLQIALVRVYGFAGIFPNLEMSEKIEPGVACIMLSNHQSMFDIPLFAWALPRNFPKYISKRSLAKWIPGISYNLRHGGHALIDRNDRNSSVKAIRKLARAVVADGASVIIFPEGTRGRDGTLSAFKHAGSLALLDEAPDAPIVPVCIHNSWQIMKNDFKPVPFGIRVRVWFGDPIERRPDEDRKALLDRVEGQVAATLKRFREEDA
ncbi:MAG: lysophospholipid acyltransferase family protein [Candidatus Binatia bacterium]|nr:lysophospholipid acyltransferase family protein [Candidatus Binatia bacterium]